MNRQIRFESFEHNNEIYYLVDYFDDVQNIVTFTLWRALDLTFGNSSSSRTYGEENDVIEATGNTVAQEAREMLRQLVIDGRIRWIQPPAEYPLPVVPVAPASGASDETDDEG